MDDNPKRILILTSDAGFGHRSAANAIAAALDERYGKSCQKEIVNPLEDKRVPFFLRDSQYDYDNLVRNMPELYRFGYDASDAAFPATIVESAMTVMMYEVMHDLIRKHKPDAIVTTYPLYQAPLIAVYTIRRIHIPFYTVVTDLATVHRIWFEKNVDGCLVPTKEVRQLAISCGLKEHQIHMTGIPVNPELRTITQDRVELRRSLGWEPDLLTVMAVGGRRVGNLQSTLNVINHFGIPLQLAILTGDDENLYQELNKVTWHIPVQQYKLLPNLAPLMHASDIIICKAGGLIVTESLACGLPMMLIDIIPGQEEGNADFVVKGGAGEVVKEPLHALEIIAHWTMDDQRILKERKSRARQLGKPDAAFSVAEILWKGAEHGSSTQAKRRFSGRLRLANLLRQHNIPTD